MGHGLYRGWDLWYTSLAETCGKEEVWGYTMANATKRYERTDVYAETFRLKATDDLIKKLRLEITQLKEENDSLKRAQGGRGQNCSGGSGGGGYNGNGG